MGFSWRTNLCKCSYEWITHKAIHIQLDKWGSLSASMAHQSFINKIYSLRLNFSLSIISFFFEISSWKWTLLAAFTIIYLSRFFFQLHNSYYSSIMSYYVPGHAQNVLIDNIHNVSMNHDINFDWLILGHPVLMKFTFFGQGRAQRL